MNTDSYKISTYWRPRAETAHSFAHRLARMFEGLAATHPVFARWNKQADTREEANIPFCSMPPNLEELTAIAEATERSESPYHIGAWNGIDDPRSLSFHAMTGQVIKEFFVKFSNTFDMSLPRLCDENADLLNTPVMKSVLLCVIAAWQPDWASLNSRRYLNDLLDQKPIPVIRSGWMTYLSAPYAQRISVPPQTLLTRVGGGGILMLATEDTFTANNPVHVAAADTIQRALEPLQADPLLKKQ